MKDIFEVRINGIIRFVMVNRKRLKFDKMLENPDTYQQGLEQWKAYTDGIMIKLFNTDDWMFVSRYCESSKYDFAVDLRGCIL
nr:MAG: hypothetical protein [Microvirus Sku28]